MKKLLLIIALLISSFINAQENYRTNQIDKDKIKKINPEVLNSILMVEINLQKNNDKLEKNNFEIYDPYISIIKQSYGNNKLSEKEVSKIESIICYSCYENEWKKQLGIKNNFTRKIKKEKDSIEDLRISKFIIEQKKQDSVKNVIKSEEKIGTNEKENPYDLLQRSLYAFSKTNRNLALFRKMDFNYSSPQLSSYLQSDMGLASKSFKIGVTDVTETFIPKVSQGNEYLTVKYLVTKRKDIIGIYEADEVMIISSVEISGTPNLIVDLFLNYWPKTVKIGGYKQGDIAYKELLGDYITILGITPKLYKIKITKGNMDLDYEKSYGINKKK